MMMVRVFIPMKVHRFRSREIWLRIQTHWRTQEWTQLDVVGLKRHQRRYGPSGTVLTLSQANNNKRRHIYGELGVGPPWIWRASGALGDKEKESEKWDERRLAARKVCRGTEARRGSHRQHCTTRSESEERREVNGWSGSATPNPKVTVPLLLPSLLPPLLSGTVHSLPTYPAKDTSRRREGWK